MRLRALATAVLAALAGIAQAQPAHEPRPPAAPPARSIAAVIDPRADGAGGSPQRAALLATAEAALARGDAASALADLEQAALLLHAADTEMGIVRAQMQTGAYREALAFAAHTAGAHADAPAASALYAWLLRIGGQPAVAARVLDQAAARVPGDAVVRATRRAVDAASPRATGVLLDWPQHMAPHTVMQGRQPPLPPGVRGAGSAVLLGDGELALMPSAAVGNARQVWVRNGLGQTTEARVELAPDRLRGLGVARLRLAARLDPGPVAAAPRDAFAGSPGFAVEYAATSESVPAWPLLHDGFLGGVDGRDGLRRLGIELPPGPRGGAVFDAVGRLAGIALPGRDGSASMLPVSLFDEAAVATPVTGPRTESSARMPADEVYERALKVTLQVLALP